MTVLDPRLLPLIETLAGTGADWLAFEIVDGLRRGREPLESEELLRTAREKVRSRQIPDRLSVGTPVLAELILGDDQIVWAANYVAARLEGVLADLDEGCAMIEAVADSSSNRVGQDESSMSKVSADVPVKIALIGQEGHSIDRGSIAAAKEGVASLRVALDHWSLKALGNSIL